MRDQHVRANGIDIHYHEEGSGPPLLLLHGGVVSSNPIWGPHPFAYASHVPTLAKQFVAFRALERGQFATIANTGHVITNAKIDAAIEFLRVAGS